VAIVLAPAQKSSCRSIVPQAYFSVSIISAIRRLIGHGAYAISVSHMLRCCLSRVASVAEAAGRQSALLLKQAG
jgi:hypothetical protein